MFSLKNKITLVTGAGSGIGTAIAELFAQAGGHVYVADRDVKAGQETVERIKELRGSAELLALDVSREDELEPAFATIVARIGALGKSDRPLFRDEAQALVLYKERLPAYRRADLTVDTAPGERPEEIAARIALRIGDRRCAI